ncbi:MAG: hypothetical protein C5B50_25350 [Verrucomicrobia bacterium]|nr:MAG: hypothetical protein C5B50_25350 [Verrucomicrobiota bacterium]
MRLAVRSIAAPKIPCGRRAALSLEGADRSALWDGATCRADESGDMSPHSKTGMDLIDTKRFA